MRTADPALHDRRRSEIVQAAQRCFVVRGFHQSTMAEIAAASGLSMGLLYRYFPSKGEIIIAVSALDKQAMLSTVAAFASSESAQQAVSVWIARTIHLARDVEYATLACEIVAEAARNPTLHKRLAADNAAVRTALVAGLKKLQKRGAVGKHVDAMTLADVLMMIMDGAVGRAAVDDSVHRSGLADQMTAMVALLLR
jgi:TetR/AcrR family transcriptional regulator, repressor for uid operon